MNKQDIIRSLCPVSLWLPLFVSHPTHPTLRVIAPHFLCWHVYAPGLPCLSRNMFSCPGSPTVDILQLRSLCCSFLSASAAEQRTRKERRETRGEGSTQYCDRLCTPLESYFERQDTHAILALCPSALCPLCCIFSGI